MADVTSQALVPPPSASLWPQPPQQQQGSLLSNPASVVDLANKLQQNYIQNQELKSRAAVGQAYQGALQPDGTLDPQKFRAGLANPDANWALPETTSRYIEQQNANWSRIAAQKQWMADRLGALANDPKVGPEAIRSFTVDAARAGIPGDVAESTKQLILNDPQGITHGLQVQRAQAIGSTGLASRVAGPPTASGATGTVPLGETVFDQTGGGSAAPAARGGGGPARGPGAASVPAIAGGTMPTSLPAGAEDSVRIMQTDLNREGETYQGDITAWDKALTGVNKLTAQFGKSAFGPGVEQRQRWASYIQSLSPDTAKLLGIDPNNLADFNTTVKNLANATQRTAQGFGHGTDAQLAQTIKGQPNVSIDDLSLPELIRTQIALRKAQYIQVQEASKDRFNYPETKAGIPPKIDVRALTIDQLPKEQKDQLLKSLSPAERSRFNFTLGAAQRAGVMDVPSRAQNLPPLPPGGTKATGRVPQESVRSLPPENLGTAPAAPAPGSFEDRFSPAARLPAAAPVTPAANVPLPRARPPVPGARPGRHADGSPGYFVPDPNRPGKYLAVMNA